MGETSPPTTPRDPSTLEAYLRQAQKERDEWKARYEQKDKDYRDLREEYGRLSERASAADDRACMLERRINDGLRGLMGLDGREAER